MSVFSRACHPLTEETPKRLLDAIPKMVKPDSYLRFMRMILNVDVENTVHISDLKEEEFFKSILNHISENPRNLMDFFRLHGPKLKNSHQELISCNYRPDGKLINKAIYELMGVLPGKRIDFLRKMGIDIIQNPVRVWKISMEDFKGVLVDWYSNKARQDRRMLEDIYIIAATEYN